MAMSLFAADSVYDFSLKSIDGQGLPLSSFKGKAVLLVNTASKCGYTPQYTGPEHSTPSIRTGARSSSRHPGQQLRRAGARHERGNQDHLHPHLQRDVPHVRQSLGERRRSGPPVSVPVTGRRGAPLELHEIPGGRDGKVIKRFDSKVTPDAPELATAVEAALATP